MTGPYLGRWARRVGSVASIAGVLAFAPQSVAQSVAQPAPSATQGPQTGSRLAQIEMETLRAHGVSVTAEEMAASWRVDADGDGATDRVVEGLSQGSGDACLLIRDDHATWRVDAMTPEDAIDNIRCLAPTSLGGRTLIPVVGTGRGDDTPRLYWESVALYAATPGSPPTRVWSQDVYASGSPDAGWRFTSGPAGTLDVAANMGDDMPPGTTDPLHALLAWNAAHTALDLVVGWRTPAPAGWVRPAAECTGTPGASVHLRPTQTLGHTSVLGAVLPAHTTLTVLAPGTLRRGDAQMYWVAAPGGARGYAFLLPGELHGCAFGP